MRELMNNFNYYSTYKINKYEEKVSFRCHTYNPQNEAFRKNKTKRSAS